MQIGRIVHADIVSVGRSPMDMSYIFRAEITYQLFQRDIYLARTDAFSVPNILSDLRVDVEEIVIDNLQGLA